jgi:hypothetical protein
MCSLPRTPPSLVWSPPKPASRCLSNAPPHPPAMSLACSALRAFAAPPMLQSPLLLLHAPHAQRPNPILIPAASCIPAISASCPLKTLPGPAGPPCMPPSLMPPPAQPQRHRNFGCGFALAPFGGKWATQQGGANAAERHPVAGREKGVGARRRNRGPRGVGAKKGWFGGAQVGAHGREVANGAGGGAAGARPCTAGRRPRAAAARGAPGPGRAQRRGRHLEPL